VGLKVVEFGLD